MAPNAYVHIHYLQPHADTENSLPIRSYGIIPVLVENNRSRLEPQFWKCQSSSARDSRRNSPSAKTNGRPMSYTVAVVDEGLLGDHQLPDPGPLGPLL
jgi:uncharacterized protein YfaS (alpha-2-macroglobulin family)